MQKTKKLDNKNINTLLRQKKSKQRLNSKNLSDAILKDVYFYQSNSEYNKDEFIVVELSTKNNLYSKKYIIDFIGEQIDMNYINKQFKRLYTNKNKTVFTYNFPKTRQILRLKKPLTSSKIWKYISNFILDISTQISFLIFVLLAIFLLLLLNISSLFISFLSIVIYFAILILVPHYVNDYLNKNRFIMYEFNEDSSKNTNITNEKIKKLNIDIHQNILFQSDIAHVNVLDNKNIELKNDKSTWIFESDEDVISEDFIEFYEDYGGDFNNGDDINIQIAPYNNNILDDNMYLSDCGNWILKSDLY